VLWLESVVLDARVWEQLASLSLSMTVRFLLEAEDNVSKESFLLDPEGIDKTACGGDR